MRRWIGGALACLLVATAVSCGRAGADENTVVIGAGLPLTGPTAFAGAQMQQAIQLVVDQANATGGVHGKRLVLAVEDSQGDPVTAANVARKLIVRERASALVAGYGTPESVAASNMAEGFRVPIALPFASGAEATERGHRYLVSLFPAAKLGVRQLAIDAVPFVVDRLKPRTVGIVSPDISPFRESAETWAKWYSDRGVRVVTNARLDPSTPDYTAAAAELRRTAPDVVMTTWLAPQTAALFTTFKQFDVNPRLFYADAMIPAERPFVTAMGSVEGLTFTPIWLPGSPYPQANAFADDLVRRYGSTDVNINSIMAGTSTQIVVDALRAADPADPDAVARAMRGPHRTMLGPVTFDQTGLSDIKALFVQIQNGRTVTVLPQRPGSAPLRPWEGWRS